MKGFIAAGSAALGRLGFGLVVGLFGGDCGGCRGANGLQCQIAQVHGGVNVSFPDGPNCF